MINKEIIPAFDLLLEELENIIPELNNHAKQLMDDQKYLEAKEIIAKAENVIAFEVKVKNLRQEWADLNVPIRARKTTPGKKKTYRKLQKGYRTPDEAFKVPILQALENLGGSAKNTEVFAELEKLMKDQFTIYDWQSLPSNKKSLRWKNTAAWARLTLVKEGFLSRTSPRGIWEITEAGIKHLNDKKG